MSNFNKHKYAFDLPKNLKLFALPELLDILELHQLRLSAINELIDITQNHKSPYLINEKNEIQTNVTKLDHYIDINFDQLFQKELMSIDPA
jgi:hypothetical protein